MLKYTTTITELEKPMQLSFTYEPSYPPPSYGLNSTSIIFL